MSITIAQAKCKIELNQMVLTNKQIRSVHTTYYVLDVLWFQPIKLIQVVSTLVLQNFTNMDGMTLILFFSSPPFNAGPQKPQTLTSSKNKYDNS